jgi:shikimate dehydrogenase
VAVVNRSPDPAARAAALGGSSAHVGTPADLDRADLVVNATPLGMEPTDPLPVDVAQITPSMLIGEIVMKREITPLVDAARTRGCRLVFGHEMLREQMPLYLQFFGLPAVPGSSGHGAGGPP